MNKLLLTVIAILLGSAGFAQTDQQFQKAVNEAYTKFQNDTEGKNASYIKELANVDPKLFGIAIVTNDGRVFTAGDIKSEVSIQSISKAFVLASVIQNTHPDTILNKVGVDATGLPFNSIIALEVHKGKEINSLVNPGAISTTALMRGDDNKAKLKNIVADLSDFAGRPLVENQPVYKSEAGDNERNKALSMILNSYGRMYYDPIQAVDIYTHQCAISVNTLDLATMGATLANGGYNPVTKKEVVSPSTASHTLAVMATAGLYDNSGIWFYKNGIPAKSGVGGGIVACVPGKFGIAVIAPPLDEAGNSVKAQKSIQYIVEKLKANPYTIQPIK